MEKSKGKWKLEATKKVGIVVLKRFSVEREIVHRNNFGTIESETPVVETRYLLEVLKNKIWFFEKVFEDLCFVMEKEWDAPSAPESLDRTAPKKEAAQEVM